MTALDEGIVLGDAIDRYIKKKRQIDDYGRTDKAVRQWHSAARELAVAFANFQYPSADDLEGWGNE